MSMPMFISLALRTATRRAPLRVGVAIPFFVVALLLSSTSALAYTAPRVAVVRVVDASGGRLGESLREQLEKELKKIKRADVVTRDEFASAALARGISAKEWLTKAALPVILDGVDGDYVIVGRLLRASAWGYELQLIAVNGKMRRVAGTTLRASTELRGGRDVPALSARELRQALADVIDELPPVQPRRRPTVSPPAPPPDAPAKAKPSQRTKPKTKDTKQPKPPPEEPPSPEEPAVVEPPPEEPGADAPEEPPAEPVPVGPSEGEPPLTDLPSDDFFLGEENEAASFDPMAALAAAEAAYSVGGRMILALEYQLPERTWPWFAPWVSPSYAELYADARPSDRVRAFVQGRVDYDFTAVPGTKDLLGNVLQPVSLRLDQLWAAFDIFQLAFVTVGRQRIRWGTGRIWNPTDFLNQQRRDSLDVVDRRLGVDLIKVDLPIAAWNMNNSIIAEVRDAFAPATAGVAFRSELAFASSELALSGAFRLDEPVRLGVDGSIGLWIFDFRAELVAGYGSQKTYWRGRFDTFRNLKPAPYQRDGELLLSSMLGMSMDIPYWNRQVLTLGTEYFYNSAGYREPSLYPWLLTHGAYEPLYLSEHYAALYAYAPAPFGLNELTLELTTVGNFTDLSFLTRLNILYTFLTFIQVGLSTTYHYGADGELHLELDVPPVAGVPGLSDGLSAPPPFLDVRVTLLISF